jgi:hypothetical protein
LNFPAPTQREILITFHSLHKEKNMSVERSEEVMRRYIAEVISEQKLEVIDEIAGRRAVRVATAPRRGNAKEDS